MSSWNSYRPSPTTFEVARRLLMQQRLDVVEALTMLNALPPAIGNDRVVQQARDAVSATAMGNGRDLVVARYALARVIVLLKKAVGRGSLMPRVSRWFVLHVRPHGMAPLRPS